MVQVIYIGIKDPERDASICNAVKSGIELEKISKRHGLSVKRIKAIADNFSSLSLFELFLYDGVSKKLPLGKFYIRGGFADACIVAYKHHLPTMKNLCLPQWKIIDDQGHSFPVLDIKKSTKRDK